VAGAVVEHGVQILGQRAGASESYITDWSERPASPNIVQHKGNITLNGKFEG
jgi:hypothetical protein